MMRVGITAASACLGRDGTGVLLMLGCRVRLVSNRAAAVVWGGLATFLALGVAGELLGDRRPGPLSISAALVVPWAGWHCAFGQARLVGSFSSPHALADFSLR